MQIIIGLDFKILLGILAPANLNFLSYRKYNHRLFFMHAGFVRLSDFCDHRNCPTIDFDREKVAFEGFKALFLSLFRYFWIVGQLP